MIIPFGTTANRRFTGFPDVPKLTACDVSNFEASSQASVSISAKTLTTIIARLAKKVRLALASPEVQKSLQAQGFIAKASTPKEMTQRIDRDMVG